MQHFIKRLTPSAREFLKKRFFPVLFLCCLYFLLSAQDQPDSSLAEKLLEQGRRQWKALLYDSAYASYRLAQAEAGQSGDSLTWARSLEGIGKYYSQAAQLDLAEASLDSIISLPPTIDSLHPVILYSRKERAHLDLLRNEAGNALIKLRALEDDCERLPSSGDSIRGACYELESQALFYQGDLVQGLAYSQKALEIYERVFAPEDMRIAICHNTLAIMYMYQPNYELSLEHFLRASELLSQELGSSHPQVIQVKTNIGVLYGEMGLFWKSLEFHTQNLPYLDSLSPLPHLNGLLNMGSTLISVGKYVEALGFLDQAEAHLMQYPGLTPDNYAYLALQRSLATERLGDQSASLQYINEALRINKSIYGLDHPALITDYMQQGILRDKLGQYEAARNSYSTALGLAESHLGPRAFRRGHLMSLLGESYEQQGLPLQALPWYQEAQDVYIANGNRFDQAKTYMQMAVAWRELGNWDSTLEGHRRAWETLMPEIDFALAPGPEVLPYWTSHPLLDLLAAQAKSLEQHYEGNSDPSLLKAALAGYEACLAVADSQTRYFDSPESKQATRSELLPLVESAVGLAIRLQQSSGDIAYTYKAFLIAERSKAANLREHLRGIQALRFAGIPDSLLEQEQYYRQRLAFLNQTRFAEEGDSTELALAQEQSFDLSQAYQGLIRRLEKDYPAYYQLKYSNQSLSAEAVLQQLKVGHALYSYLWGEQQVFVFRLYEGQMNGYCLSLDSSMASSLGQWLSFISQPPASGSSSPVIMGQISHSLAELLLPGLPPEATQLNVLPDGSLGYLAFESLLSAPPASEDFHDWSWLGQGYPIAYANAAEIWLQQQGQGASPEKAAYLGFAPDFSGTGMTGARAALSALSFNHSEIEEAARLLHGQALNGLEAREGVLKNLGPDPLILHFATHAIADEEELMQSRIYFQEDSSSEEDGILYAYEVYGLRLNSPLAVLSACQTGKGPVARGEGVMSLARAFQYAGSQRVLTTLWQSDDRSGASLIRSFFQDLKQGSSTSVAMQQARKKWLEQSDTYHCHPYFWAGMVLIGEGGELELESGWGIGKIGLWAGVFLILMLGGIWYVRKG